MPKPKKGIHRDNTGVATLTSIEVDIDSLPEYQNKPKSHKIKIMDSQHKNAVSAVRES